MKAISEFLPEILELHCVTKNSPVTFKTRSRSLMTMHVKNLFTRCTCGMNVKTIMGISAFLPEIIGPTRNSPVTFNLKMMNYATKLILCKYIFYVQYYPLQT